MYCKLCGDQIEQGSAFCSKCGTAVALASDSLPKSYPGKENVVGRIGWFVLGLLLPIIGFIIWIVWRKDNPSRSKAAGAGALTALIVVLVLLIAAVVVKTRSQSELNAWTEDTLSSWFGETGEIGWR